MPIKCFVMKIDLTFITYNSDKLIVILKHQTPGKTSTVRTGPSLPTGQSNTKHYNFFSKNIIKFVYEANTFVTWNTHKFEKHGH